MRELDKVLEKNEKVLWEGAPNFLPFVFSGSQIGLSGIVFFAAAIPLILIARKTLWFLILFFLIMGLLMIIWFPLYKIFLFRKTYFMITEKRILIQTGIIGRDFGVVDFNKITSAAVLVGFFDVLFGNTSGSIAIATAGPSRPYLISNISEPYEVFKILKKYSKSA